MTIENVKDLREFLADLPDDADIDIEFPDYGAWGPGPRYTEHPLAHARFEQYAGVTLSTRGATHD